LASPFLSPPNEAMVEERLGRYVESQQPMMKREAFAMAQPP